MSFPPSPFPYAAMVNFATWQKYIRRSQGSEAMQARVIHFVTETVPRAGDMMDGFKLGYALGFYSGGMTGAELKDFETTIALTRDLNNVPIVQMGGRPVS